MTMIETNTPLKQYCQWTCSGTIESLVKKYCKRGSLYVVLGITTNDGTVYFYIFDEFLLSIISGAKIGEQVTLSGVIGPENQSHKQNIYTPYFLNPDSIEINKTRC